ncbi:MAG TPA: hypothetical protein VMX16_01420 [Terriglobia bacterium]|nr:hypothetical protein [Terriglobia bacterium]
MNFWREHVIQPALDAGIDEEIQSQHSVLGQDPTSAKAWFGLGSLYHVRGNKKEAMDCFLHSIEIDSGFSAAHVAVGRLYAVEGNLNLAWEHARQAERQGDNSLCEQLSRHSKPLADL